MLGAISWVSVCMSVGLLTTALKSADDGVSPKRGKPHHPRVVTDVMVKALEAGYENHK